MFSTQVYSQNRVELWTQQLFKAKRLSTFDPGTGVREEISGIVAKFDILTSIQSFEGVIGSFLR
ncbi:MAG: hypothetical protein COT74_12720 [Bdellovibrionales bacterium CG10_big_fil_rev_8_21_14_0_10_45_34]|nr:MAG: hypothetical protein COT74_12720 [Bdellovibrionales bacterium CG10_big_fil_rev_8_21_14_0_10_45_34]